MKVRCIEQIIRNGNSYQFKYSYIYPFRLYSHNHCYVFPKHSFYKNTM